jgi:hypothetical protein
MQATKTVQLFASQLVTDGATVTANLDCLGAKSAKVIVNVSTEETTHSANYTVELSHSDDTVVTNFATIRANVVLDPQTARIIVDDVVIKKRYLRVKVTAGTTTGGDLYIGAIGILSRLSEEPKNTSDMTDSTHNSVNVTVL